jgi:hypothetical protein
VHSKVNYLLSVVMLAMLGSAFAGCEISELLDKATKEGQVAVIVGLKLPSPGFIPEGKLTGPGLERQRALIVTTRDALLKSLSGNQITVYGIWESLPSVALKVDETALKLLVNSPYVSNIQEDSPEWSQNAGTGRGVDTEKTP